MTEEQQPSQQAMRAAELINSLAFEVPFGNVSNPPIEQCAQIIEREMDTGAAVAIIRGFINCLQHRRDWLDPDVERAARNYLSKHQPNQP